MMKSDRVEAAAMADLVQAMGEVRPACRGDARFIDDLTKPAAVRDVCRACPLLNACREYATIVRPSGGIWAGRRWNAGRPSSEPL